METDSKPKLAAIVTSVTTVSSRESLQWRAGEAWRSGVDQPSLSFGISATRASTAHRVFEGR